MSYDIPDEIKYKEKIVFGLTFKQLGYLCAFGFLALLTNGIPFPGMVRLVLPLFFVIVGVGFVFLNFEERAVDAFHFLTGIRLAKRTDAKAVGFVGVKSIQSSFFVLSDGGLRAILRIDPVNFNLLEDGQKKSLILSYREFLNHLTAPVQIIVKTRKPKLGKYFETIQEKMKKAPDKLSDLFDDFYEFEQDFLRKNHVRERQYYLVIGQDSRRQLPGGKADNSKEAEELLEQRTSIVEEKLAACGLKSRRLEKRVLERFLSTFSSQEADSDEDDDDKKQEPAETGDGEPASRKN